MTDVAGQRPATSGNAGALRSIGLAAGLVLAAAPGWVVGVELADGVPLSISDAVCHAQPGGGWAPDPCNRGLPIAVNLPWISWLTAVGLAAAAPVVWRLASRRGHPAV